MAAVANLAESRMKLVFVDESGGEFRKRSVTYSGLAEDAGNEALLKIASACCSSQRS